jgi:hypothetical protein
MPFKNRIRLPFYVTRPQFPTESNTFRLANGRVKTLSSIIRKVFEGETENLPREIHERLIVALKHDDVTIEGKYYLGGISLDGDYEIDWQNFLDFPLAKAAFKVEVTPFDYSNDNCQTCEDLSQVVCEDDDLGTVNEDDTITVHVLNNDSICCTPVTISLVTYNSDYLDSCIISGDGIIIHLKPILPDANGVVLVTYRAECPNGAYDEANIIADINGSAPPVCLAPTGLFMSDVNTNSATVNWTAPTPAPASYDWEIYNALFPGVLVQSGNTVNDFIEINSLFPNTVYNFFVRGNCGGSQSNFVSIQFQTLAEDATEFCGSYTLANTTPSPKLIGYVNCSGDSINQAMAPYQVINICALQTSPGVPIEIITPLSGVTVTYNGLC